MNTYLASLAVVVALLASLALAKPLSNTNCLVCSFDAPLVSSYIAQGDSPSQILDQLLAACSSYPFNQDDCKLFDYIYAESLIGEILTNNSAATACYDLGFCEWVTSAALKSNKAILPRPLTNSDCLVCTFDQPLVEAYVSTGLYDPEQILAKLLDSCSSYPYDQQDCQLFDYVYGPSVIQEVITNHGANVCADLGFCSA